MSPWSRKSKTSTCLWSQDSFPWSPLLMTMFPYSLLEGDNSFSITHPFPGFRFCVISHVSASKLLSFITVTCTMDTRKAHTVLYNVLSHHPYTSPTVSGFSLVQHITQKSYFIICHGYSRPSIFNLTYLWYPFIAVQWHNLHVPITCLNLQSHDNISCQTCCYLIFWNFLVYLWGAEN